MKSKKKAQNIIFIVYVPLMSYKSLKMVDRKGV